MKIVRHEEKSWLVLIRDSSSLAILPVLQRYKDKRCSVRDCDNFPSILVANLKEKTIYSLCEKHYRRAASHLGISSREDPECYQRIMDFLMTNGESTS